MRAFQEPSQALLHFGGPVPTGPSEDAQGWAEVQGPDSGVRSGDVQSIKQARQDAEAPVQVSHAAGQGSGGHNLLCTLHKPEFPHREDIYEEQETLNPIKREK